MNGTPGQYGVNRRVSRLPAGPDHPGRAPPAPTSTAAIPGFGDGRRVQPGEAGSVRLAIERLDAAPGGRLRRHHVEAVVADVAPGAAECGTRVGVRLEVAAHLRVVEAAPQAVRRILGRVALVVRKDRAVVGRGADHELVLDRGRVGGGQAVR